jgi:hypothetical protein
MTREESQLAEIVARIIDIRRAQVRINPSWIATEALKEIDPSNRSVELVRLGCHLHLRQIARGQCRKLFDPSEEPFADEQSELFENLQWRYPVTRTAADEPEYILREHMTNADIAFNVGRFRRAGRKLLAHADTLEAWGRSRGAA